MRLTVAAEKLLGQEDGEDWWARLLVSHDELGKSIVVTAVVRRVKASPKPVVTKVRRAAPPRIVANDSDNYNIINVGQHLERAGL